MMKDSEIVPSSFIHYQKSHCQNDQEKKVYNPERLLFLISQIIAEFTADLRRISAKLSGFICATLREGERFLACKKIYTK